jgi:hypothetical protein
LNLAVGSVAVTEDVVPDPARPRDPPGEELLAEAFVDVGDVHHAAVQLVVVDAEEVLQAVHQEAIGAAAEGRVARQVDAFVDRPGPRALLHVDPGEHVAAWVDHMHVFPRRHRSVGPEIVRMRQRGAVGETDLGFDATGPGTQPDADGPGHAEDLLDIAHPDGCAAVRLAHHPRVHGGNRGDGVAAGEVELDPAGDPGAPKGDQAGLDDVVAVENLATRGLVHGRVQVAAEFGQDGYPQAFILQHQRAVILRARLGAEIVEHGVRVDPPGTPSLEGRVRVRWSVVVGGNLKYFDAALNRHSYPFLVSPSH